jgi:hypothetical protein
MEPMRGVGIPTFARPGDCVPSRWGIRGDSGTRPPRWRLQERNGPKGKERKGHAGGDAAEQSHQIGGKDVLRGFPP